MYNRKRNVVVNSIRHGITNRGFHIVTTPDEIPGCKGSKQEKLECLQKFADENGWYVTIHNGNGWILFTASEIAAEKDIQNDIGQLLRLLDGSLLGDYRLRNPLLQPAG